MLKDRILQTINDNETYQKVKQTFDDVPEYNVAMCLDLNDNIEILSTTVGEFLSFKDRVLEVIRNNVYFQYLIAYEIFGTNDDSLSDIIKFASADNKIIMSADNRIIVPSN